MRTSSARIVTTSILLLLLAAVIVHCNLGLPYHSPGTTDFIQYWSALHLIQDGINPYDGDAMHRIQILVGQSPDQTVMMWNPPWMLLAFLPLQGIAFPSAALLWLIVQIGLLAWIARVAPSIFGRPSPSLLLRGATAALFYPVIETIHFGQSSIMITAAVFAFLYCDSCKRYGWAGVALVPLSWKPHLFLLLIVPGFIWIKQLSRNARRAFLWGACSSMIGAILITMTLWPNAIQWWISSFNTSQVAPGVVPKEAWMTASTPSLIRGLLREATGELPYWPLWVVPLISLLATAMFFYRRNLAIEWRDLAPPLLCLSLITSSYGWLYDQSLLLVCQLALVHRIFRIDSPSNRFLSFCLVAGIQIAAVSCRAFSGIAQHHYVWVPLSMLLAWWLVRYLLDHPKITLREI